MLSQDPDSPEFDVDQQMTDIGTDRHNSPTKQTQSRSENASIPVCIAKEGAWPKKLVLV